MQEQASTFLEHGHPFVASLKGGVGEVLGSVGISNVDAAYAFHSDLECMETTAMKNKSEAICLWLIMLDTDSMYFILFCCMALSLRDCK